MNYCPEQQRVACAMGGIYTALAIEKVLPILHCGPGCQTGYGAVMAGSNGGQNAATYMESSLPCTNFCETDVVFGGEGRLRKLISESLRYYDADIFLVAGGCTPEIVGDDIAGVVGEFNAVPVLNVSLPGFNGNNLRGHSRVLHALIDQYIVPNHKAKLASNHGAAADIIPGQVNVLGIIPYYDTMWSPTLEKLEGILIDIGLTPNILYGRGKTVDNLQKVPSAQFNLVLAPWTDLDVAETLRDRFGTPYFHYPNVPIGPTESAKFIRAIADYAASLNLKAGANIPNISDNSAKAEAYIAEQDSKYNYFIDRSLVWIFDMHNLRSLPRSFFIISGAAQSLALTKFLVYDLGLSPRRIFITDETPEARQADVAALFDEIISDGYLNNDDIVFTDDGGALELYLRDVDQEVNKSIIFGTVWDDLLAKKLNMPYVPVSAPYGDILVGNKTYFGWDGAIELIRDIYNDTAIKGLVSSVI
jgi:nitrogenase molybdenum-iron protein beta chain